MLVYPDINPIAFSLGPLKVHWYGIMYLLGFGAAWLLGNLRAKNNPDWNQERVSDLIFYGALGVVLGGRIGFMLFYAPFNPPSEQIHFWEVWKGGMSFHGGLLGVLVAMWLYGRKIGQSFFQMTDFVAPLVPTGLLAGRIGNFINSELWGKPTDLPWGFQLQAGGPAVHPSQLYEAGMEGVLLFIILWVYSARPRPVMSVSGMFLLFYGLFRFLVEFVRLPDKELGYLAFNWLTMGQVLSLPMIVLGLVFIFVSYRKKAVAAAS